jgi:NADH-quinone oxidoreductase subunit L
MPDFHGPIQHVTLAGSLWLIVIFPLAAALVCGWNALVPRRPGEKMRDAVAIVSLGAMGLAFATSAYHAWALSRLPDDERFLLQHAWRMVRLGQLDASFDLALDTLSSTMTLVVTGIGLPIFLFATASMRDGTTPASYARFFAWMNAFVFAMLVLVLADNFVLLFFGWEGVGLCSWGLIGFVWSDGAKANAGRKAFLVNRIGDAGFVLGVALFYWGFGGAWAGGDYVPDLNARFSSVEVRATSNDADETPAAKPAPVDRDDEDEDRAAPLPKAGGDGFLTLTSYPGAAVFMDDARAPMKIAGGDLLRSPFVRRPVKAGFHSFRIHPGGGLDDFLVTHVSFGGGREIALASFGPTVTFREARDQLAVRDAHGRTTFRDALLAKRGLGAVGLVTIAGLLLFVGAMGKSAQFPLHVWLPDAMAGPTPVSALIHAATMVTAGVYLIARLGFFFALSPAAGTVIAIVGATTALFAAVAGLYQYDLKRVLAYSTISQLGLMVLAVGVGGYAAGVFHLVTHACFKACLFLSAGALIHVLHHVTHDEKDAQDVRRMGGLGRALPRTARAYAVGCLAMTAAPIPGLAGFWSKDDILVRVFTARNILIPGAVLGGVALVVAALTSFYMWRTYYLVFEGEPRSTIRGVTIPEGAIPRALAVLAGLSVLVGVLLGASTKLIGRGGDSLIEEWLEPSLRGAEAPFANGGALVEWAVIVVTYACAAGGWALARSLYAGRKAGDAWEARERRSPLFAASTHGFWVDALYAHTFVALTLHARDFAASFDRYVVDSLVNAAGVLTRAFAWVVGRVDDDVVDGGVRALSKATLRAGERVRAAQTGRVQSYVYVIVLGILALAFLQYWLR